MNSKVTIDFKQFNKQCKAEVKKPFILDSVTIDIADEDHFKFSIRRWEDALERWWNNQKQ